MYYGKNSANHFFEFNKKKCLQHLAMADYLIMVFPHIRVHTHIHAAVDGSNILKWTQKISENTLVFHYVSNQT